MGFLSHPYQASPVGGGYWGSVTSTIDWCEENYVVNDYVAEMMNTLTNGIFVALAGFAIYNCITQKLDTRFLLTSIGFAIVGVGSWLFHMTLKYEYQLLDELPMIYSTCIPAWSVFSHSKLRGTSLRIAIAIATAAGLLTAIYLRWKNPTIHQAGFAALTIAVLLRSMYMVATEVHDPVIRANMWKTIVRGVSIFLAGYALWQLDIHACSILRRARHQVGMPLGFLLEGHAWWHLLTGVGVYYYLIFLEYLRLVLTDRFNDYEYVWKFGFPSIWLKKAPGVIELKQSNGSNLHSTTNGNKRKE